MAACCNLPTEAKLTPVHVALPTTCIHSSFPATWLALNMVGGYRFADFELVARKDKPIRFYAGAPLVAADGHKIGTL